MQERVAAEVRQLRLRQQFKARPAPPRSLPAFEPNLQLARPPTEPMPFRLATSARLGVAGCTASTVHNQSRGHNTSQHLGDEEFEDDEDLDNGSGCTDLDGSRSMCASEPHTVVPDAATCAHTLRADCNDTGTAVYKRQVTQEQQQMHSYEYASLKESSITTVSMDGDEGVNWDEDDAAGMHACAQERKNPVV